MSELDSRAGRKPPGTIPDVPVVGLQGGNAMEVTRIQYPVGQGCFHAGRIEWGSPDSRFSDDFHYVYDCGSSSGSAVLQDAVAEWRSQVPRLDALFVSHLDTDHVNGIDRLLASVAVGTVYIPYVDVATHVFDILEAEADGALSASLLEAWLDPGSWFGRRGVARIVRVRPSRDDGPPAPEPEPVDDDGPGEAPPPSIGSPPKAGFDAKTPPRLSPGPIGERDYVTIDSGTMVVANPGTGRPWVLVPHVDPASNANRHAFYREVRRVLGLPPRWRLKADRLATALRDVGARKRLRQCYQQIISGGSGRRHNRVSMSLYSGPAPEGERLRWWRYVALAQTEQWPLWRLHAVPPDYLSSEQAAVGWVGTGDASLNLAKVRAAWKRSFNPFSDQIATLLLPHHGSRRSFDPSLLDWPSLTLCVASAGAPSQYGHPHRRVIHEVVRRAKVLHHVSQRPQTQLREVVWSS